MRRTLPLTFAFLLIVSFALPCFAEKRRFSAELSGSQEVPEVKTGATGDFKLTIYERELSFELTIDGIMSPLSAYLHKGKRGENGPPIAGLFGGPGKVGRFSGLLAQGTLTEEGLLGELKGKTVKDLVRLITSGQAYVNVITSTFPDGEIRGQIQ